MIRQYTKAAQPFTDDAIDEAYLWLCKQRANFLPNADIWHLRFHWDEERQRILDQLQSAEFNFSPLSLIQKADGQFIHIWSAQDALVLKMMACLLADQLPISERCTHALEVTLSGKYPE